MNINQQNQIIFYGRPDGLGNRFEELVLLSDFALNNNLFIKYYWNNSGSWKYKCKFKAKNIEILEIDLIDNWPTKNFESTRFWREYISTRNIYHNNNVFLDFDLPKITDKYVSILTRGTDRILKNTENIPPGFQSQQDLEQSIFLAKKYLQEKKNTLPISIHSEDEKLRNYVSEALSEYKQITLPEIDIQEKAYRDLIGLINSEEIILCSKFSSFALTAAMISNKKVVKFHDYSEPLLLRWKNDFINYPKAEKVNNISKYVLPKSQNNKNFKVLGNSFIKSFEMDQRVIGSTSLLISYNKKNYIGFEENFKILNSSVNVKFIRSSIFINNIKEVFEIVSSQKNRKIKIKNLIFESLKTIKILGWKSYFFRQIIFKKSKRNFFLFLDIKEFMKNLDSFLKNESFIGAIVYFDNLEIEYELISTITQNCSTFILHSEIDNNSEDKPGYLSISRF